MIPAAAHSGVRTGPGCLTRHTEATSGDHPRNAPFFFSFRTRASILASLPNSNNNTPHVIVAARSLPAPPREDCRHQSADITGRGLNPAFACATGGNQSPTDPATQAPCMGTHHGTFHADEVLACSMLRLLAETGHHGAPEARRRMVAPTPPRSVARQTWCAPGTPTCWPGAAPSSTWAGCTTPVGNSTITISASSQTRWRGIPSACPAPASCTGASTAGLADARPASLSLARDDAGTTEGS